MTFDWSALTTANAADGAEMLREVSEEMGAAMDSDPAIEPLVMTLLERRLQKPLDTESFTPVREGIEAVFGVGEGASRMYAWLSSTEQRERLEAITGLCPPALARLLRGSVGVYGQDLQDAYRYWREYPDNWDALYRQVSYDTNRSQSRIDVTIVKYNGEEFEMTVDTRSMLIFVTRLLNSLVVVASDPLAPSELEAFKVESEAFLAAAEPPEAVAEVTPS